MKILPPDLLIISQLLLVNPTGTPNANWAKGQWVADSSSCNWTSPPGIFPDDRRVDGVSAIPEDAVQDIVPPTKFLETLLME